MGREPKYQGEHSMTVSEFIDLIGVCSDDEIDRLRAHYRRYFRWHREVFINLLTGRYTDDEAFWKAVNTARYEASERGETSAEPVPRRDGTMSGDGRRRQTMAGLGRANSRKLIKMAVRILYLRMTSGKDENHHCWHLPCDHNPAIKPADAKKALVPKFEKWGVGYDAIRQKHTPFQSDV